MTKVNAVDLSVYQAACIKLAELLLNISGCQVRISQGASPTVSLGSSPVAESSVYQSSPDSRLSRGNHHSSKALMTYLRQHERQKRSNPQCAVKTRSSWTLYQLPVEAAFEAAGETALHVTASLLSRKSNLYWGGGKKRSDGNRFSALGSSKKNPLQGISFNVLSQYCKHTHNNEARVQSWSFQDWDLFVKENVERCILPNVNLIIRAQQLFFIAI